jgi:hypothetical protein
MGIAESIVGVASVSRNGFVVARSRRSGSASSPDAPLDKCDLLSAISNRPIATSLSNDIHLLEKRTLVPLKSDLEDLAGFVKGYKMSL